MRSPLITMSTIQSSGRANTFREQRARLGRPWIPGLSGSGRPGVRNRWSKAVSRGTRHSRTHSINQQCAVPTSATARPCRAVGSHATREPPREKRWRDPAAVATRRCTTPLSPFRLKFGGFEPLRRGPSVSPRSEDAHVRGRRPPRWFLLNSSVLVGSCCLLPIKAALQLRSAGRDYRKPFLLGGCTFALRCCKARLDRVPECQRHRIGL